MNNEELKKKIADIVLGVEWTGCLGNTYHISGGMSVANAIADALIEAGLNFGKVVSHTATFDLAQLERINRLEIQAAEAEHRAARAERALRDELVQKAIRLGVIDIRPWYIQALNEAEKKIAEENE